MGVDKLLKKTVFVTAAAAGAGAWAVAPRSVSRRAQYAHSAFPDVPFAHRGLHDAGSGIPDGTAALAKGADSGKLSPETLDYVRYAQKMAVKAGFAQSDASDSVAPENSLAAFAAACEAGYGIEIDVRLTRDGRVVVAHDDTLRRIAGDDRAIRNLTYDELTRIPLFPKNSVPASPAVTTPVPSAAKAPTSSALHDSHFQHVPLLSDVLAVVDGRVPLIVEYKMGRQLDEELMRKADALLGSYESWYCMESFNPLALHWYRRHRPNILRGQLAAPPSKRLRDVRTSEELVTWSASNLLLNWAGRPDFIAYEWHGGLRLPVKAARALGATAVAWTVRSTQAQMETVRAFDGIIFESFLPARD